MKRFSFSLERVRRWRETVVLEEELQFKELAGAILAHTQKLEQLQAELGEQRRRIAHGNVTTGAELERLRDFSAYASRIGRTLRSQIAELEARREAQRVKLAKARLGLELLNRLKDREHGLWRSAFERELQATADEIFSAREIARRQRPRTNRNPAGSNGP